MHAFAEQTQSIARPPSPRERAADRLFQGLSAASTAGVVGLLAAIVLAFGGKAIPAILEYGPGLIWGQSWDAGSGTFGILPEIWGTLYSALLALVLGGFFGISIAIFLTQNFLPRPLAATLKCIIELLAAIPSVVYGLWGIFVLIPLIRPVANFCHEHLGWLPFFSTSFSGPGLFPAALVLAIMILPTVAALSQDALEAVPKKTREAAFGLGATRWEAILRVMLPTAKSGIYGALTLGLGRALGETMALAMLVGNTNQISLSVFSPANTLATLLALNFPEAGDAEIAALMFAACVLLFITLAVNMLGAFIINKSTVQS